MRKFFFTILNCSEKLVILRWKIVYSNFYINREIQMMESFFQFEIISCRNKILKILNF